MIFLLENIRSKFNIGSIFRIADIFGVEEICLVGFSVFPPDKEISKTAIGAEKVVKWIYFQNTEDAIFYYKKKGFEIIGVEIGEKSVNIKDFEFKKNQVFIFGNEISGVSDFSLNFCEKIVFIPMKGKVKESLNVGITAGIVGYLSSI